ncbi:MAG: TetR/AcrR family transcriptional regulator [Myxococcales bacterium]|nr:TetR/AcrR family transcriptional regulator [Myxococcales bacterium]
MPRHFDAARRTALVEQTLALMRARGVGRLTMSELATALGVKRPTLYFYFRDLSGLLLAAVEEVYRGYATHIAARLTAIDHPIEALGELARATVAYQHERRDLVILLFQLWAAGDTDPEVLLARSRAAGEILRADLVARVRVGVERGVVAPCEPERIVDLVLTVLDGTVVQSITRTGAASATVDELWRRVLAPLIVSPPPRRRPRSRPARGTS